MGWTFVTHAAEPGEIKARFTRPWETSEGETITITDVKATSFGRHLWGVWRSNGEPGAIVLWLVERRKEEWGYHDMSEEEGPSAKDCPLELLDKCPCPDSQFAREWRERVRLYHAACAKRRQVTTGVKVGDTILFGACYLQGRSLEGQTAVVEKMDKRTPIVWDYIRVAPEHIAEVLR